MLTKERTQKQVIPAKHIHAGVFTVENTRKGTWKTFKIRTQRDTEWSPGARLVSILKAPNKYVAVGYLNEDSSGAGYFHPFANWAGSDEAQQARFFINMMEENVPHPDIRLYSQTFCMRCGLALTTPQSVIDGLGPDCVKKVR